MTATHRVLKWQRGSRWFCVSKGWQWRWLWRRDIDGSHLCVFGVLIEWRLA